MLNIVIDSGVLIALFDGSDRYHQQAVKFIQNNREKLHTNLAVITETVYMLDFSIQCQKDFLGWVHQSVHIDRETASDIPRIIEILQKYSDLPADFADASLVALCERLNTTLVASVDNDFTIYRNAAKKSFKNMFLITQQL